MSSLVLRWSHCATSGACCSAETRQNFSLAVKPPELEIATGMGLHIDCLPTPQSQRGVPLTLDIPKASRSSCSRRRRLDPWCRCPSTSAPQKNPCTSRLCFPPIWLWSASHRIGREATGGVPLSLPYLLKTGGTRRLISPWPSRCTIAELMGADR